MILPFLMLMGTQLHRFLPLPFIHWIADISGSIWYRLAGKRREIVRENLAGLGIDFDEQTVKKLFRNFVHIYADLLNLPNLKSYMLDSFITGIGVENLQKAIDKRNGVILVSGHVGAWEIAGPYIASRGYRFFSVAESEGPGMEFFKFYLKYRELYGANILRLEDKNLTLKLLRVLKNGSVLTLIGDRDITGTGRFVEYNGRRIRVPVGPAFLSWRTGVPVCIGYMVRKGNGKYLGWISEPIYPEDFGGIKELLEYIATQLIERTIKTNPDFWFVFERVWKNEDTVC